MKSFVILVLMSVQIIFCYSIGYSQNSGSNINCYSSSTNLESFNISGITFSTASQMAVLYHEKQANYIRKQAATFLDSRSVWFSLDKLKAFIAEIERKVCDQQCEVNKLNLGIRLYFAAYPDSNYLRSKVNSDYDSVKSAYGKYQTLFMVPTFMDMNTKSQVDFDPRGEWDINKTSCTPKPLKIFTSDNLTPSGMPSTARMASNGSSQPHKLLILSSMEPQYFLKEYLKSLGKNKGNNSPNSTTSTSILNHGNTIPPDTTDGTAF